MSVSNPISITYGQRTVGGSSSTYQLNGPYVIDKSFTSLRLVFEVVVVSGSVEGLKSASDSLETDFRERDKNLTITMGGSSWSYVFGDTILNTKATIQKTGNRETDRGVSRAYTIVVEGELPADDQNGLREIEVNVTYAASRQKTVTMRGQYTALDNTKASAKYLAEFDTEAGTILSGIDGSAVWELAVEDYTHDRLDHTAAFSRQYVELLADQSQSGRDDTSIKDHRVTFTDLAQHPGDALADIYRMRRVVGTYDCAVDIDVTTGLEAVWRQKVRPHVIALFEDNFEPTVFAVEDYRITFDETAKRLSCNIQFLYQKQSGGEAVVEVAQSLAYREQRQIDYTPVHGQQEYSFEVDPGWAVRERVWSRTVVVLGDERPKMRIGEEAQSGDAGLFEQPLHGVAGVDQRNTGGVMKDGWNVISNTSQASHQFIGDPDQDQIRMTVLTETVVERFHKRPETGTTGPQTPGGGGQ